jgi:L-cysteine desulfidase
MMDLRAFSRGEVEPARGCTEPVAVAVAASSEAITGEDFRRNAAKVGEIRTSGFTAVDGVVLRLMEQCPQESKP